MDSNIQPTFSIDQARECQSFPSNRCPCKISIGIPMDSFTKSRPKDITVPTDKNVTTHKVNSAEDCEKMLGVPYTSKGNQSEVLEPETSPWLSTRSFHKKLSMSEQVPSAEATSILFTSRPIFETHNSVLVAKDETAKGFEKPSFDATNKASPEEDVEQHQTTTAVTKGSQILRTKLWEILGTISSPNKQLHSNMDAGNMKLLQKNDGEGIPVVKAMQNSDTIETDSECPELTVGRPVTRYLTRKNAAGKLKSSKVRIASPCDKKDNEEVNNSFPKMFSGRLHCAVNRSSLVLKRKRSERRTPGSKARVICSPELENTGRNQSMENRRASYKKSPLHGNGSEDEKGEFFEPKSVALGIDAHQVHLKDVTEHLSNMFHSPKLQENVEHTGQKPMNRSPTSETMTPKQKQSPDFPRSEMKRLVEESSPGLPPKTKLGGVDDENPAKMISKNKGIQSFKSFLRSRSNHVKSDCQTNFTVYAGRLENSPPIKRILMVEDEPESMPSSENSGSDAFKEASHAKGLSDPEVIFPKIATVDKPAFVLHLNKEHHNEETVKVSRKVLEDNCKLRQHVDLNEMGGLASAVSLFSLALERVKSKMKSVVRKRSADILMSVAEGIHLQLQTAESQIQSDMGKLTSISKSKRKRLDLRFQELQGDLNVINARFKDEVNRHLKDCKYTVEGLEAYQMELRGAVEKQCVSHRKLLLQAEDAIETRLNDAQRRITEVHNLAREKMFLLKSVVADCFKEGSLS